MQKVKLGQSRGKHVPSARTQSVVGLPLFPVSTAKLTEILSSFHDSTKGQTSLRASKKRRRRSFFAQFHTHLFHRLLSYQIGSRHPTLSRLQNILRSGLALHAHTETLAKLNLSLFWICSFVGGDSRGGIAGNSLVQPRLTS